jgi:hypothetical protein
VSLIRVLRTAAATLARTLYVDETLTDATGALTVTVRRLDGTLVDTAAAIRISTGLYTYTFPGRAVVDRLDVIWTCTLAGAAVELSDTVEIVGGYLFGLAEARNSDSSLADPVKYTTGALATKRIEVEEECERITGRAFVPRFGRAVLSGSGGTELFLPNYDIRVLRGVSTLAQPNGVLTASSVSDLANTAATSGGMLTRFGSVPYWPWGISNIVVEYEYGWDRPPDELKRAAMYRLRSLLNLTRSGVPDRVSAYTTPDGATYQVSLPSRGSTGIPEVDAVYQRYEVPPDGFA